MFSAGAVSLCRPLSPNLSSGPVTKPSVGKADVAERERERDGTDERSLSEDLVCVHTLSPILASHCGF